MKYINQKGFAHLLVLGVFLVGGIIAIAASVVVHNNNKRELASHILSTNKPKTTSAPDSTVPSSASTAQPAATPTQTPTASSSTPKAIAPATTNTQAETKATTPASTPTYLGSLTISADGCTVTATAPPGMSLLVQAYNDRKGGEASYTIPASGTLTKYAGGIKGMTVDAQLYTSSNSKDAHAVGMITQDMCPAAG